MDTPSVLTVKEQEQLDRIETKLDRLLKFQEDFEKEREAMAEQMRTSGLGGILDVLNG